jgi:hypothetical protein
MVSMNELRGKLRRSVIYDNEKGNYQPNIMDTLREAEIQLNKVKSISDLEKWKHVWFEE